MRCKMYLSAMGKSEDAVARFDDDGNKVYERGEVYSLTFYPVYHADDPKHENSKYWAYTPSGALTINTVNAKAVEGLVAGREYYVDVTPAFVGEE